MAELVTEELAGEQEYITALYGRLDRCQPWQRGERVAQLTGGELLLLEGAGHLPNAREPVVVNRAIRDFARRCQPGEGGARKAARLCDHAHL